VLERLCAIGLRSSVSVEGCEDGLCGDGKKEGRGIYARDTIKGNG
jgi:hypothetical protein